MLAKKFDRFGWERDRNTPAHDRLMVDWMDALQDYPMDEVRAACRAVVKESPNRMPNEGHVVTAILAARRQYVLANPPKREPEPDPEPPRCAPEDQEYRRQFAESVIRAVASKGASQ